MIKIDEDLKKRLEVKIDAKGPNDCWNWTAHKDRQGYGRICINRAGVLAHRVVYQSIYGDIPPNMCVMHTCDNPSCCNPNHLMLGTVVDNNLDRHRKNRTSRGSHHTSSKLMETQVKEIFVSHETLKFLSRKYGVSVTAIHQIKKGKTWNWFTKDLACA